MKLVRARALETAESRDQYGRAPTGRVSRQKRRTRRQVLRVAQQGLPRATLPPGRVREARVDRRLDRRQERLDMRQELRQELRLGPGPERPDQRLPLRSPLPPPPASRFPRLPRLPEPPRMAPQEQEDDFDSEPFDDTEVLGRWQAPVPRQYGPLMPLGANLRVQASEGTRAGMIELRPGLFLVAEIPVQAARSEFGLAVLAPLVTSVALKALENPETQQQLASAAQRGVALVQRQLMPPQPSPVPWANADEVAGVVGATQPSTGWSLP